MSNKELWFRCDNCYGMGGFDYTKGYEEPSYFKVSGWKPCDICKGFGWLDWVSHVRGQSNRTDYFNGVDRTRSIKINNRMHNLILRLEKDNDKVKKAQDWLSVLYTKLHINDWKWRGEL